jgi:hypothetical protein
VGSVEIVKRGDLALELLTVNAPPQHGCETAYKPQDAADRMRQRFGFIGKRPNMNFS